MKNIKKSKNEENPQLDLQLKEPWTNKIWKYIGVLRKKLTWLDLQKFLKEPNSWLLLIAIISVLALTYNYFANVYQYLPTEIPLLYNYNNLELRLIDSSKLYTLVILSVATSIITILIAYKSYNQKKYLSYILLLITILVASTYLVNIIRATINYIP